jgi:hypothetical protein
MSSLIQNALLRAKVLVTKMTTYRSMIRNTRKAQEVQMKLLQRILRENAQTGFGQEHGFAKIATYSDFVQAVPVQSYDSLFPYLNRQAHNPEDKALVHEPFLFFNITSGTTSASKFIPVTATALKALQRSQDLMVYLQQKAVPNAYQGKVLGIASPAVEGVSEHGIPIGSASGRFYKNMPKVVASKYVVPYEVLEIKDSEWKYYTVVLCCLQHSDITYFATANPSTVLKLMDVLNVRRGDLWRDLVQGRVEGLTQRQHDEPEKIHACIRPTADRLRHLEPLLNSEDPLGFESIWPRLRLFSTWTGGSCGVALKAARRAFPSTVQVVDLGLIASEIRATVTTDPVHQAGLPTFQDNVFEFVEKARWDREDPEFLMLNALTVGEEYYLFVTTPGGLYRYHMNDIVLVTGYTGECPVMRFVQKGRGACNITGEKLYEGQVLAALEAWGVPCIHAQALADAELAKYVLYIEPAPEVKFEEEGAGRQLDMALRDRNMEYDAKRESGRLQALEVRLLRAGTLEALKAHAVAEGQREGQFKTVLLQNKSDLSFDLESWRI